MHERAAQAQLYCESELFTPKLGLVDPVGHDHAQLEQLVELTAAHAQNQL